MRRLTIQVRGLRRLYQARGRLRRLVGWLLGLVARLWLATLRLRVDVDPALGPVSGRPWVLTFFHGTQWPLLAWPRRRRTVVLVSLSRDGELQAGALAAQGLAVERGSSSRGGARGLAALVRRMRRSRLDAAFAVDGPRGPYGHVHEGALAAARATGGVLVPMGAAVERGFTFERAWDRFAVAWPWSRVAVVLGAPVEPGATAAALGERIRRANADAATLLLA
jgi:lysophospholipid acyltransferase (LPLAT)-like uncharacterized protein